ncbi:XRE family transcriptional regulator [Aquamicrobium sp. LC103]|uniref:helix-turn-helix domain-containing protein n=1 Tax=Aquamicrobium sp. LC103 TaxID=1120658 RepID=UPI00063EAC02|nr:XRE family transcriptional regulator [Aquamicrobium sp. LC103]TKT80105.1 helix-turn-helix transcriptional regulator [Aquamicrobium sp. LC103]
MSIIADELRLGERIRQERQARGWSLGEMAEQSGVSKAMLSKVEREEASPTAELLVRIAAAFAMTLSSLIARAEGAGGQVLRAADQPRWRDPATGYVRRHVSPAGGAPIELIHVELPAGKEVRFPAASYTFIRQLIWVISGSLHFNEEKVEHRLAAGDCLRLGAPSDCRFFAPGPDAATYLVALLRS